MINKEHARCTGIRQFFKKLPQHIIPIQKSIPPYTPVTNGYYGYQGVVLLDSVLDRIQCHICGRWFKCLSAHLRVHDVDHITYKDRFGLYRNEPLARLSTLKKWSEMNKIYNQSKNTEGRRVPLTEQSKAQSRISRQKTQWQNKYGTCPAQIKFRIEEAIKKWGKIPTSHEESNLYALVTRRFGSFEKGLIFYKIK